MIPEIVSSKAVAHRFDDSCVRGVGASYWRDVGTLDAFWEANIGLTDLPRTRPLGQKLADLDYSESVPPAKFIHDEKDRRGIAVSSMVSGGCIISGTEVRNSLLFTQVHTSSYAVLDHSIALPDVKINRSARLRKCIIDRGVEIPTGLVVGEDPIDDAKYFRVTEKGTTLITHSMIQKWLADQ